MVRRKKCEWECINMKYIQRNENKENKWICTVIFRINCFKTNKFRTPGSPPNSKIQYIHTIERKYWDESWGEENRLVYHVYLSSSSKTISCGGTMFFVQAKYEHYQAVRHFALSRITYYIIRFHMFVYNGAAI